jgi:hypothetical protein
MRPVPAPEARATQKLLLSILAILEMSMLKKLVPAILGAMLIASPVIGVTTATAAAAQTTPAKMAHHKAVKHKAAAHHAMKKHSTKHSAKHVAKHHAAKKKAKKAA